jgi:hypothetical protein
MSRVVYDITVKNNSDNAVTELYLMLRQVICVSAQLLFKKKFIYTNFRLLL